MFCKHCGHDLGKKKINYCTNCGGELQGLSSCRDEKAKTNPRKYLYFLLPLCLLLLFGATYLLFFSRNATKKDAIYGDAYLQKGVESKQPEGFTYNVLLNGTIEIARSSAYKSLTTLIIPEIIDGRTVTAIADLIDVGRFHQMEEIFSTEDEESSMADTQDIIDSLHSVKGSYYASEILGGVFQECDQIQRIELPPTLTKIGVGAFAGCSSLEDVTLPTSVKHIGSEAFRECNSLREAIVSDTLVFCGRDAFPQHTALFDHDQNERPLYAESGEYRYVLLNQSYTGLVEYLGNELEVKIPDQIDGLKVSYLDSTFRQNSNIEKVEIPSSVNSLGFGTFVLCDRLTEVNIPDTVETMGLGSFASCESLREMTLPNSLKEIGDFSFFDCDSFHKVIIPDSSVRIGVAAFAGCSSMTELALPNSLAQIDAFGFLGSGIKKIEIPPSVRSFGFGVFMGSRQLEEIVLSDNNIVDLGLCTFASCPSLTKVEFPKTLQKIGAGTFAYCVSLKKLDFPDTIKSIGTGAFSHCFGLREITLPRKIEHLGNSAFKDCKFLEKVTIPPSLIRIHYFVFLDCASLKEIYYGASQKEWADLTKDVVLGTNAKVLFID